MVLFVEAAGIVLLVSCCDGCTGKGIAEPQPFPGQTVQEIYLKDGTQCAVLRDLNEPHVSGITCNWKD